MKRAILWFRNDLRLTDHKALTQALKASDEIIPVYILDSRQLELDHYGFRKTGPFRQKFLYESLSDLNQNLQLKGSQLLTTSGKPEEILPRLAREYGTETVFAHKEVTDEEVKVEMAISQKLHLRLLWGSTLHHRDDLPMTVEQLPDIFTGFRKAVEKKSTVRPLLPAPDRICSPKINSGLEKVRQAMDQFPEMDPRTAFPSQGGSSAACSRLEHYFYTTQSLSKYKFTRNGLIGKDYSSKFSPWLANGSVSPRQIYWEVKKYEQDVTRNISTYWLIFELIWRDYFRFVAMKYGNKIFQSGGIKEKNKHWSKNRKIFERWRNGTTGQPFVDANMRELLNTGWMSNRGRQNVASFLVHDLGIDWRMGAAWFESQLLDYDPCSNYGNWMYVAGIGNDPRENRKFDVEWQANKYDPKAEYVNLWLKK